MDGNELYGLAPEAPQVLLSTAHLAARVDELAAALTAGYRGRPLTVIVVLNGALVFAADLVRRIPLPLELDTVSIGSYIGQESTGTVRFHSRWRRELRGRHVLVVEDILDTGRTLAALCGVLRETGAVEVRTCVLLNKRRSRAVPFEPDYVAFEIPDAFVVGYGLDCNEQYRNLPYVAVLRGPPPASS